jgi:hypothetical protein
VQFQFVHVFRQASTLQKKLQIVTDPRKGPQTSVFLTGTL